ncbi:MAG: ChaN family lipoprotein [Nitrospirota bacterium]|nr:MAG: ChaN family lipoprotein [Nitrospirota bacterium]
MRSILKLTIIFLLLASGNVAGADLPEYDLHVRIDPGRGLLNGQASIRFPDGSAPYIHATGLNIQKILVNGKTYDLDNDSVNELRSAEGEKEILIEYSVLFEQLPEEVIDRNGTVNKNVISSGSVMLLSGWYPEINGLALFRLSYEIPSEMVAISESDSFSSVVEDGTRKGKFEFDHPTDGITMIAGKYHVTEETDKGTTIRTFLLSDDENLSRSYLERSRKYIHAYEEMLGEFPFKSFSVVENSYQTGYSFPTYTLLGSRVIRLPFILDTSLGHEILHQWFGNSVYIDRESGNWSEGLTAYLSDHWFEHIKGNGADYRKRILTDHSNYVSPDNEISISEFRSRKDYATRTIGYGKTAMLFHMLRKKLGDDAFFQALRYFIADNKYRKADWEDISSSFIDMGVSGLEGFFDQWIERKGIPSVSVKNVFVSYRNGNYVLELDLVQERDIYALDVPIEVSSASGTVKEIVRTEEKVRHFEMKLGSRPQRVVIDPEYDLMRELSSDELPPVISSFTGNKENVVIFPEGDDTYSEAVSYLKNEGFIIKSDIEAGNTDIKGRSVLLLSGSNRIYKRLFAGDPLPDGGLVVKALKNPLSPEHAALVVTASSAEEIRLAFHKISRYGNYSFLVFEQGRNMVKEVVRSDSGIVIDLGIEPGVVDTGSMIDLDSVINAVKNKRVIFVGEVHNIYSHHVMQYEIIRRLNDKGNTLVIGMEMFQAPFQGYLDRYISGEIDERELLKGTEYFSRWKFDYALYRDILNYAKDNKIPVVALNLRKELIEKVSKEGIDSLNDEERSEIPPDIDMTNEQYFESMREVFFQHSRDNKRSLENFFQSQILWDETMALRTVEALKRYPGAQIVVLAGGGHLQYSWGIPDRVRRMSDESTAVVLNGSGGDIESRLADFVLYPPDIDPPKGPKMMAFLDEKDDEVIISRVIKGGVSEKAGIKEGDKIISIEDEIIVSINDLKLALFGRKVGDRIKVRIRRPRLLFGEKEIELEIEL